MFNKINLLTLILGLFLFSSCGDKASDPEPVLLPDFEKSFKNIQLPEDFKGSANEAKVFTASYIQEVYDELSVYAKELNIPKKAVKSNSNPMGGRIEGTTVYYSWEETLNGKTVQTVLVITENEDDTIWQIFKDDGAKSYKFLEAAEGKDSSFIRLSIHTPSGGVVFSFFHSPDINIMQKGNLRATLILFKDGGGSYRLSTLIPEEIKFVANWLALGKRFNWATYENGKVTGYGGGKVLENTPFSPSLSDK